MSQRTDPASLLLQRLQDDNGPWPARVTQRLIDFAMNLPVSGLVNAEEVRGIVALAITEASVQAATETHVTPAWHRQLERARTERDTVGDALPPAAVTAIEGILERGKGPRFAWLHGAVEPKLMAQLIAPIVQQVLLGFVTKLSGNLGGLGGSSAGLMGMLGRSVQHRASALADVGKAVMGGIGVDVEKKLHAAAKDFSHSASSTIRDAVQARLRSDEGQALVRQISKQVFAHIRATPVHVIQDDIDRIPVVDVIALVPAIVDHNRQRKLIAKVIDQEVDAALNAIGSKTVGDLLTTHGLRNAVESIARRVVPKTLGQFFADPATVALVQDLLRESAE